MMSHIFKPTVGASVVIAALLAVAIPASADIITITSDETLEGLGAFTGSIDYDAATFQLTVTLTNTSDASNGGFITGFVFNIASQDPAATASLTSATHPFLGVTNHAAPPFGHSFDAGAALGGNWSGGGNPNFGIAVGDTGVFVFDIIAFDAMSLSVSSFANGEAPLDFAVRFRGFDDGGSDKALAVVGTTAIPGPSVLALLALCCITGRFRRRAE